MGKGQACNSAAALPKRLKKEELKKLSEKSFRITATALLPEAVKSVADSSESGNSISNETKREHAEHPPISTDNRIVILDSKNMPVEDAYEKLHVKKTCDEK